MIWLDVVILIDSYDVILIELYVVILIELYAVILIESYAVILIESYAVILIDSFAVLFRLFVFEAFIFTFLFFVFYFYIYIQIQIIIQIQHIQLYIVSLLYNLIDTYHMVYLGYYNIIFVNIINLLYDYNQIQINTNKYNIIQQCIVRYKFINNLLLIIIYNIKYCINTKCSINTMCTNININTKCCINTICTNINTNTNTKYNTNINTRIYFLYNIFIAIFIINKFILLLLRNCKCFILLYLIINNIFYYFNRNNSFRKL